MRYRPVLLVCAAAIAIAQPALAQGRGNGNGRPPRTVPPANKKKTATAGRTALPVAGVVLAAWLDDADTLEPGHATMGVSVGRWTSQDGGETDAPAADVAVGVARGVQIGASLPYYRASYSDGYQISGLGDSYFVTKLRLLDPGEHAAGFAVSPTLEVLSKGAVSDTTLGLSRVNWALPVSMEVDRDAFRTYATVGYFSRGAVSAGGAVERTLTERVTLAATVSYSHTTKALTTTDLADLSPSRTDIAGGLYYKLAPAVTVAGSIGRTISKLDQNGARFTATGGISVAAGRPVKPKT